MSHPESVPPEQRHEQQQEQADDLKARLAYPEVVPKAKRRQFTARYKLRILETHGPV